MPVIAAVALRSSIARADDFSNYNELKTQAAQLEGELKLLMRRARHPGTPGTPFGIPAATDAASCERSLLRWRASIERLLLLPDSPPSGEAVSGYLPLRAKVGLVDRYFSQLTLLAALRVSLRLPHGARWAGELALQVPDSLLGEIQGLGIPQANRFGDQYYPVVIDTGDGAGAGATRLRISLSMIQGLELGSLADRPDDDSFLTMIQFLTTRQLLQNLSVLRALRAGKPGSPPPPPAIPAPLRDRLETLGLLGEMASEQKRSDEEASFRLGLEQASEDLAASLPSFATDGLIEGLADAMSATPRQKAQVAPLLKAILSAAEKEATSRLLAREIQASGPALSRLAQEERTAALRDLVANAKANTLALKLMELRQNHFFDRLSRERRESFMELLARRREAYRPLVPGDRLLAWQNRARELAQGPDTSSLRKEFIETLLTQAPLASERHQREYSEGRVDVPALSRSFRAERAQLSLRPSVDNWLFEIIGSGDYPAARARYAELMAQATEPAVIQQGLVDPKRVRAFVATHDFAPEIRFSPEAPARLSEKVISRLASGRKKDIEDLLAIGEWMGFHLAAAGSAPGLARILGGDEAKLSRYFATLQDDTLTRNPILAAQVTVANPWWNGGDYETSLAKALARLNPDYEISPRLLDRAAPLVDQALDRVEAQILDGIREVGEATDLGPIEAVVRSSLLTALAMKNFPEFHFQQEDFLRALFSPSVLDQVMHRYVGNYIVWGGAAAVLIHLADAGAARWAKPLLAVTSMLSRGVSSLSAGYMRSIMLFFLADTAYQAAEVRHAYRQSSRSEDFFFSSAWGPSFVSYDEMAGDAEMASSSGIKFGIRLAADSIFMYLPFGKQIVSAVGDRVAMRELEANARDLSKLGLGADEFDQVELALRISRDTRAAAESSPKVAELLASRPAGELEPLTDLIGRVARMGPEEFAELERAGERLAAKVRAGRTYRLPSAMREMLIEDAFRTLRLGPHDAGSWDRIEEMANALCHGTASARQVSAIRRAERFLKKMLKTNPAVATERYAGVTLTELRLAQALGRSPKLRQAWQAFTETEVIEEELRILSDAKAKADTGAEP